MHFQVFGSKSSQDLDCMVFVQRENLPSSQECHNLCNLFSQEIQSVTDTDKEINTNICIIKDGVIIETFKGTEDEVNNSLLLTYDYHKQYCDQLVERLVSRDVELKILRTARTILSFWSRSQYRPTVKSALRSDIHEKIEVLSVIQFPSVHEIRKSVKWEDYLKVMAFQLGQVVGLIEGVELYTKEDIADHFEDLKPFLMREDTSYDDLSILEDYKVKFLNLLTDWEFTNTFEKLR